MKKLVFLIILFLVSNFLWADYHPNNSWKEIKTEHFNIVYDIRLEEDAKSIANDLENLYISLTDSMGGKIDRYTIVLPAELTESNGYVSPVNNKSVFYPTPPTDSFAGAVEWYELLTIHETRHMAQQTAIRNSVFQRILEFLFGSYGIAGAAFIPSYFYEGDAVLTETLLSDSGRGRSPSFERSLRTILLSDQDFSFAKALHRSGRDYFPNYYVLGYYLMTYLKREFGTDVLPKIVNSASNNILPMNFSLASLTAIGQSMPTLYDDVMYEIKNLWEEQDSKVSPTEISLLASPKSKYFTNMNYPQIDNDGNLLFIESGLDIDSRLVVLKDEKREIHKEITGKFSLNKSNIIFSEISSDPRWTYRSYSDIFRYNLTSKKKIKLTNKARLYDPVYSSVGDKIAAIEFSIERVPSLVILDSESGEIMFKKQFKDSDIISGLDWSDDDTKIVLTVVSSEGIGIGIYSLEEDDFNYITESNHTEKRFPKFYKNNIIFVSSHSGIDNINIIDLKTSAEFQLISSLFGANYPSIIGDTLIFSDYTVNGYRASSYEIDLEKTVSLSLIEQGHVDYFKPLLADVIEPETKFIEYEPEIYNPNTHLIDIHSWVVNPLMPSLPTYDRYLNSELGLGDSTELILFSNDQLEYMDATLFSHISTFDNSWDIGSTGIYRGFYPEIRWDMDFYSDGNDAGLSMFHTFFDFNIPLLFSSDSFSIGVTPYYIHSLVDGNYTTLDFSYYLTYSFFKNDFMFGSTIQLNHGIYHSSRLSLGLFTEVVTPGVFNRDDLTITNNLMWGINDSSTVLGSYMTKPQSALLNFDEVESSFFSYHKVEYYKPLFYPDISIFDWVYFNAVNLYAGYESYYSQETNYNHIISGRLSINYYLLRIPLNFRTEAYLYYDINSGKLGYSMNPFTFDMDLL